MEIIETFSSYSVCYQLLILIIILWDGVWKLLALWRAARRREPMWFIFIAILNTVGVLPILYLLTHSKK